MTVYFWHETCSTSNSEVVNIYHFLSLKRILVKTTYRRAARGNFFECLIPQSCNKVHSEVQVIKFQEIPACITVKCGAIAIESICKISD